MRILVATDGSEQARLALVEAAALALAFRADVTVLTVAHVVHMGALAPLSSMEFPERGLAPGLDYTLPSREEVARILEQAETILAERGVTAALLHAQGDPASAILETAERLNAEMIVVGAQGQGAIRRFLVGSVAEKVMRHAPCTVVMARGEAIAPPGS